MKVYLESSIILRNSVTEKIIEERLKEGNGKLIYVLGYRSRFLRLLSTEIQDVTPKKHRKTTGKKTSEKTKQNKNNEKIKNSTFRI